ncbi:MAG TPA: hypothetical protein ENJ02_06800 [Chloroflexi bacterium]|nr:hypothetical protein [Chloroflexota bacterium]
MDYQEDDFSAFEDAFADDDSAESDTGLIADTDDSMSSGDDGGNDNRTFLIVAGILGALILLTLACMAIFLLRGSSSGNQARQAEIATVNAQNTQVAEALSMTQLAQAWTPTFTATSVPPTATNTPTAVVAMPTDTPTPSAPTDTPTPDYRQATIDALATINALTQTPGAGGGGTGTGTPSATALPNTGFADEVGLPGLAVGAVALLLVIFLARRLRTAS